MLPTQECFGAAYPVDPEVELGLVVQHELVRRDGVPELADQREALGAEMREVGGVLEHGLVCFLGGVHREIRALEEVVDLGAVRRPERDPDARFRAHGNAGDVDVGGQRLLHAFEDDARARGIDAGEDEPELVASEPGEGVAGAEHLADGVRRCGRGTSRRCGGRGSR